jgi:hypothetical protein
LQKVLLKGRLPKMKMWKTLAEMRMKRKPIVYRLKQKLKVDVHAAKAEAVAEEAVDQVVAVAADRDVVRQAREVVEEGLVDRDKAKVKSER